MLVVGIDPAFANMGLCSCYIDPMLGIVRTLRDLQLVTTAKQDKKLVRASSDDFRRARELRESLQKFCNGHTVAFAEIPSGSQSARASWSLGIAVGVLASCPLPVIQVSPIEVKLATVGKKTASKDEMIEWATSLYPDAPWRIHRNRYTADNEHLADAVAIVHAGIRTADYAQIKAILGASKPIVPRRKLH